MPGGSGNCLIEAARLKRCSQPDLPDTGSLRTAFLIHPVLFSKKMPFFTIQV